MIALFIVGGRWAVVVLSKNYEKKPDGLGAYFRGFLTFFDGLGVFLIADLFVPKKGCSEAIIFSTCAKDALSGAHDYVIMCV